MRPLDGKTAKEFLNLWHLRSWMACMAGSTRKGERTNAIKKRNIGASHEI